MTPELVWLLSEAGLLGFVRASAGRHVSVDPSLLVMPASRRPGLGAPPRIVNQRRVGSAQDRIAKGVVHVARLHYSASSSISPACHRCQSLRLCVRANR